MRRALLVAAVFALSGCDRRAHDAFVRGETSMQAGDLRTAAVEFRQSCRLDPKNEEFCRRADEVGAQVKAEVMPRAIEACGAGDGLRCIEEIRIVDEVLPGPESTALLERGAALFVQRCQVPVTTLADAMFHVRCIESIHNRVRTPGYEATVRMARAEARDLARSLAIQQRSPAAAVGYGEVAKCFLRDDALGFELASYDAAFRDQMKWRLRVDSNAFNGRRLCEYVAEKDRRVACGGAENVLTQVEIDTSPVRHDWSDEHFSKEYVSAVIEVENVAWREQRDRVVFLAGACREADEALARKEKACEAREKCKDLPAARENARKKREEHEAAKVELNRLPQFLQQEQRSTHRWVRRTHTWTMGFSVAMTAGTMNDSWRDSLTWTAVEQPGFRPAGVDEEVATSPSGSDIDLEIWSRVAPRFTTLVRSSLDAWGREHRKACPVVDLTQPEQVQCATESAWLMGASIRDELVAQLARQVDSRTDLPRYANLGCQ